MTANPLKVRDPQASGKRTPQEWADRGNAILAGQIPMEHGKNAGQFMRRDDIRWVVRNGQCVLVQTGWSEPAIAKKETIR